MIHDPINLKVDAYANQGYLLGRNCIGWMDPCYMLEALQAFIAYLMSVYPIENQQFGLR